MEFLDLFNYNGYERWQNSIFHRLIRLHIKLVVRFHCPTYKCNNNFLEYEVLFFNISWSSGVQSI